MQKQRKKVDQGRRNKDLWNKGQKTFLGANFNSKLRRKQVFSFLFFSFDLASCRQLVGDEL